MARLRLDLQLLGLRFILLSLDVLVVFVVIILAILVSCREVSYILFRLLDFLLLGNLNHRGGAVGVS